MRDPGNEVGDSMAKALRFQRIVKKGDWVAVDESRRCFFLSREVQFLVQKRPICKNVSTILSPKLNRCKMFLVFVYFKTSCFRFVQFATCGQPC